MRGAIIGAIAACVTFAGAAQACIILPDSLSPAEMRWQSERVAVDSQCRAINVGVEDRLSLGAARALGDGRIFQVINDDPSRVFLADCSTREVTILRGDSTMVGETSCGPILEYDALVGPDADIDLSAGRDLHELVDLAEAAGAFEQSPSRVFFEFSHSTQTGDFGWHEVGRKDRFDLLCGCKLFYPDSPGAAQ